MTRLLSTVRLAVALTVAGLIAPAVAWSASAVPAGAVSSTVGTPLPAGWQLCVLQGLTAPVTQANVADLAAWQDAEGGSTNNSAAYNPFNTRRTTNFANQPLPAVVSSNGFPAFANWTAGCAATVATILQMNMWSIDAALRGGNVSPPGAFLAAVDETQWCAPSGSGQPCYLNAIVGSAGAEAQPAIDIFSALSVFSDVKSELHNYEVSVLTTGLDQNQLTAKDWQLVIARSDVSTAENGYLAVQHDLRGFAVDEYENSGLFEASEFLGGNNTPTPFGPPDANGVVAHQYERVIASALVARLQAAEAGLEASVQRRSDANKAVTQAAAKLLFDDEAEDRSLARLVSAVATMQNAGACTAATLVSTPVSARDGDPEHAGHRGGPYHHDDDRAGLQYSGHRGGPDPYHDDHDRPNRDQDGNGADPAHPVDDDDDRAAFDHLHHHDDDLAAFDHLDHHDDDRAGDPDHGAATASQHRRHRDDPRLRRHPQPFRRPCDVLIALRAGRPWPLPSVSLSPKAHAPHESSRRQSRRHPTGSRTRFPRGNQHRP